MYVLCCVVLCCVVYVLCAWCVHSYLCVSLVHNNMCVSKIRTAYFRYTHVTVGMESYVVVLVMQLYEFLRNLILKNCIIGRFHVTSFN